MDKMTNHYRNCRRILTFALCLGIFLGAGLGGASTAEETTTETPSSSKPVFHPPASVKEARSRAYLLHETIHDTLHVVHRDFFDADERIAIPSHSFEDVFEGLERSYGLKIRWIAVDTRAMNVDNKPKTEFELRAVKKLATGQKHFEEVDADSFQFAGRIHLASQCLKCHVPSRSNNDSRSAGLVILMPMSLPDSN